ncbi:MULTISPECIES: fused MFS/spermidine synthase [unclassified Undibacterium]|uniref:fused MFS/spermidine synthase n=1 Tax=unclassified Undibacterium TaxID=2630295 RepID=UPI002AC9CF23|nr:MULTISPECIES: fused MFS/spermidine synthase [unclassified Undibacterium]MEB0138427.1 fused MFS/spermidine synthase [Undibacterium sp. CCC2.1]MEB0171302.1 fused MFS/spermidine synthase [Undibacterium sp. CCC1.1]MEB0176460.1 fused MFS/spermidine synthase [Undibacterium sp. CCC3.4]MEB0214056.1 fused MFS/spermidine synthase [Undibacterium sp. 5I2]WPX43669.1 fused MFS/spermidine synthase [Undibacterium sp. CCC3.4]
MQTAKPSLARLFLNRPSTAEALHQKHLQALSQARQGRPFLFDDEGLRMLYLNPQCMQSALLIDQPERLLCAYSRAMMAFLLACPAPRHIILIGLGGGSLVKYCYHRLPDCRITAIEIDADVIALREQCQIPPDDERLQIIHADGRAWLAANTDQADVILLDAYDQQGLVAELNTAEFYASCHRNLHADGVLVANVWGKPSTLAPMLARLHTALARTVHFFKSADSYNLLVFATPTPYISAPSAALCAAHPTLGLAELAQDWPLPLDNYEAASLQRLRSILVADENVPNDYAAWKKQILKKLADVPL